MSSLIVICGQPCSGKSTFTIRLAAAIRETGREVVVIDEESLHLNRNSSYKDVPSEKNTRGLLRSATDRFLTRNRIVIFDSLNFISGYRYELWCIARSAAARYSMVHIDTPTDSCREWNDNRQGDSYSTPIFDDLAGRFERPDARKRWDAPLFTVKPLLGDEHIEEQIKAVLLSATASTSVATAAAVAAGASAVAPAGKSLVPNIATQRSGLSSTNLLHDIDKAAQEIIDRISEATALAAGSAPGLITFGEDLPILNAYRLMPLPELRRHKRSFIKLATNNTFNRMRDVDMVRRLFIDYLRDQL